VGPTDAEAEGDWATVGLINVDWTVKEDEVSSADIKDDGEDP